MDRDAQLDRYFAGMWPHLDEHARRLVAASKAVELGYGGISRVSRACGLSRVTLIKGVEELRGAPLAQGRIRREGGGRHALTTNDPGLAPALDGMVEPTARGDPQSPLRWTCKSARTLAAELTARHHPVSHTKVAQLLRDDGYSLQGNRKTEEGDDHPDRDAQFRYINRAVKQALGAGEPVISVDTKKKELIGNYQNQGRQWRKKGTAEKVNGHDFPGPEVPRAYPYGIYDLKRNAGFVNVGTDHDTGAFAVASIRGWWRVEGRRLYPQTRRLLITADAGGSNGWRLRLWKWELQGLADQTGLTLMVRHFPPGTSKWNKIEHRMFCHITENWRGKPLVSRAVIINLIGSTKTRAGLTIKAELDENAYPTGIKVSDEALAAVRMKKDKFHGDWNYTILPSG